MPPEPKVIAIIPARWASSRFPGKPLVEIRGKPMIQWVVEQAGKARSVAEVIVATDDERILKTVNHFGGTAVMTSEDHISGTDRIAEVAEKLDCEIVVNVQGDEPLIPPENIDLMVSPLLSDDTISVSTLRIRIKTAEEMFDPNITKVVVDQQGNALYFSRAPIPYNRDEWPQGSSKGGGDFSQETAIMGYKHMGLYAYRKSFLMQFPRLNHSNLETLEKLEQLRILENGVSIRVIETDKNSIGVDRREDLDAVEKILSDTSH